MAYLERVNYCSGDDQIFQFLDSAGTEYRYGMRNEDGEFHNNEGSINGWWCTNGFAGDDFWYCSPSIYYWGVSSLYDEDKKGWGFRILVFKYLKK